MYKIISIIAITLFASSASGQEEYRCAVEGEIVAMGAGESISYAPDGQGEGGMRKLSVIFTQISLRVDKITPLHGDESVCAVQSPENVIKYGLCEDIDLYEGDVISGHIAAWNYGGDCLFEVEVLRR